MRSCSDECRVHPRNRYFTEHKMTVAEFDERMAELNAIETKHMSVKVIIKSSRRIYLRLDDFLYR